MGEPLDNPIDSQFTVKQATGSMECAGDAAGFAAFLLGEDTATPRLFQSGSRSTRGPDERRGTKTTFHANPAIFKNVLGSRFWRALSSAML